ncbi:hypothetical protein [Solimonas sp. SE-A11]|uniref:hypothetical protein n=1 Tax=Solimonas sp. SE-A11 TaxID=3054954 RepID=UPI00259C707E|nr:hypothetical protein [Solimonas sp. SE-A11]MDM4768628.1 hypothetical protein [Solimonas sp. SE-A11]
MIGYIMVLLMVSIQWMTFSAQPGADSITLPTNQIWFASLHQSVLLLELLGLFSLVSFFMAAPVSLMAACIYTRRNGALRQALSGFRKSIRPGLEAHFKASSRAGFPAPRVTS